MFSEKYYVYILPIILIRKYSTWGLTYYLPLGRTRWNQKGIPTNASSMYLHNQRVSISMAKSQIGM
jgi:hypothetical protein